MARSPDLTSAELRVMKALWEVGTGTVAEVRTALGRRGPELAYTTGMTLPRRRRATRAAGGARGAAGVVGCQAPGAVRVPAGAPARVGAARPAARVRARGVRR